MSERKIFNIDNGVTLLLTKNEKFKSNYISVNFTRNIKRNEVTKISLLSNLLSVGSKKYPTMKDISKKMDELYGLSMNYGISKYGEKLVVYFKFLTVSDKYIDDNIFSEVLEFVSEIICNPLIENGELNPGMIEIEKESLIDEINAKINDKTKYASSRCVEEMCNDEPFSIEKYGYVEDVEEITASDMAKMYEILVSTSNVHICVEGDFDEEVAKSACENILKFPRSEHIETLLREDFNFVPKETKYINEDLKTNQGKIVIGYRTNVDFKDFKNYYPLIIGNSIFGGGAHSKLFLNVREKESMCYYASSSIEKNKGIMLVSSGIDTENYDKALLLIRKELKDTIDGNFTEKDMEDAKRSMINSLRSSLDSISGESEYTFIQMISGTNLPIEKVIEYISNVSKDDIVNAMKNIVEDTVYYLK